MDLNLGAGMHRFGPASDVVELIELPHPPSPEADQITVNVIAAPIDPGDLRMLEGKYGVQNPTFPMFVGNQAVGQVIAVGKDVSHLREGDRVLLGDTEQGNWRKRVNVRAHPRFALPAIDPVQASFLLSTMTTAFCLLTHQAEPQTGEWIIQNAGNSAVGIQITRLAKHLGLRCASIVRTESAAQVLSPHRPDLVLREGQGNLRALMLQATGGKLPRYGFDSLAGEPLTQLAACLADDGSIISYGSITRKPHMINTSDLIFRGVNLKGYWRTRWVRSARHDDVIAVYKKVAALAEAGVFQVPIDATYALTDVKTAVAHAALGSRTGKIVLLPNA